MDRNKVAKLLEELRTELADAEGLDEQSRRSVHELAAQVDRLAAGPRPAPEQHASTMEELEDSALRFESEHPRLAGVLGQVMDALGKMGI